MTLMCGDFCDYHDMCLVLVDAFIITGWPAVMKLSLAILTLHAEPILRAADLSQLNQVIGAVV